MTCGSPGLAKADLALSGAKTGEAGEMHLGWKGSVPGV